MGKYVGLILAKGESKRLRGKNTKDFHGQPMFLVNVKKCLKIFDEVYVSSDDREILNMATVVGAKPIWRDEDLCGDTPNIPVYKHALKEMGDIDGIVAVQACSPNIAPSLILDAKRLLEMGKNEIMTCHPIKRGKDYHEQHFDLYGSIWALSTWKLNNYGDPLKPDPEALIVDESVDIHDYQDYLRALRR